MILHHSSRSPSFLAQVEGPDKSILYEKLLFSNIDDSTGGMLSTIVKKGYRFRAASTGLYTICLDNRMSRWTAKVAVFDLNRKSPEAAKPATGDSLGEHVVSDVLSSAEKDALMGASLMRAACNRIYAKLGQIENSQMYHYHRERRHRNTLEDTNSRVQWWTLAETLIIVVVALGQTVIVRKWFAVKETLPGGRASYDA